ncbi:Hypothetical protein GSB_153034, partial [Giardia duodenalis]
VHPAVMAWGDDEGRQRLSTKTPARIVHSPPGTASRASHASEPRSVGAPAGADAPLEGPTTRAGVGTAASPGSQTRGLALSGRESHALAEALGHGGPDRGGWGARGWGTVAAGFFESSVLC